MPTTILRPTGDSGKTLLRQPVLARNYTAVDETSPNDATDYVYNLESLGFLSDLVDTYTCGNLPANADTINSVTLRYRGMVTSGTTKDFRGGVCIGAVYYYDTLRTAGTWTSYSKVWALSPATGVAWTKAEINGLLLAARCRALNAESRITWMELEVDYIESIPIIPAIASLFSLATDAATFVVAPGVTTCPGSAAAVDLGISVAAAGSSRSVADGLEALSVASGNSVLSVADGAETHSVTDASPTSSTSGGGETLSVESCPS